MVLLERIELSASPLPRECSTTELQQLASEGAAYCREGARCQAKLELPARARQSFRMGDTQDNNLSREERLAAKLRENLRRRKAQSRGLRESGDGGLSKPPSKS